MRNKHFLFVLIILVLGALACNAPGRPADALTASPIGAGTTAPTSVAAASTTPQGTLAATPTQGALPTTAPTSSGGGGTPQRISFAPGGTSATVTGNVTGTSTVLYVINVGAGQTMTLNLTVTGGTGALGLAAPGGTQMLATSAGQTTHSAIMPANGDYTITVAITSSGAASYSLEVIIPPLGSSGGPCLVTNTNEQTAYRESSLVAAVFGTAPAGDERPALVRTKDGWIGFDPGVAQAGNEGRARLRWYAPGAQLTFDPAGCQNNLPLVLSLASLENGTYFVNEMKNITLLNGQYTNPTFDPANTGGDVSHAGMGQIVGWGDMNGDGKEDAVLTIGTNTGGTGTFVEFFVVINNNGDPSPAGTLFLDDRGGVNGMSIANGVVTADVLIHGPSDGACCPSLNETWQLKIVQGELTKIN